MTSQMHGKMADLGHALDAVMQNGIPRSVVMYTFPHVALVIIKKHMALLSYNLNKVI